MTRYIFYNNLFLVSKLFNFTTSHMPVQGYLSANIDAAFSAGVTETVWKMLGLNMVPYIRHGSVVKLKANATMWATFVSLNVLFEIFR